MICVALLYDNSKRRQIVFFSSRLLFAGADVAKRLECGVSRRFWTPSPQVARMMETDRPTDHFSPIFFDWPASD
jgi:hypothetical protein